MRPRRNAVAIATAALVLFAGALYLGSLIQRAELMYEHAKVRGRGWSGQVHDADDELGYAPVPGARGAHLFPIGDDLTMRYDDDGFRVPVAEPARPRRRPFVLVLGDSITYGDACQAEDAYPHQLALRLNGSELNAGVCGYGLAQMYVRAKRLIPRFKPDIVVVQYSPWLAQRAAEPFAPTYEDGPLVPTPYFIEADDRTVRWYPPILPPWILRIHTPSESAYRDTPSSLSDRLVFYLQVGLPLVVENDITRAFFALAKIRGLTPRQPAEPARIERFVFKSIVDICRAHDARMVVVVLGFDATEVKIPPVFDELDVPVVDAQAALVAQLGDASSDAYVKAYAHYRGTPAQLVDRHPNPRAHAIIADELANAISTTTTLR